MCFYYQPKKVVTTLLQRRAYKAYSAVGRNTDNSQNNSGSPMGHVPMGTTDAERCV
jgi:hypothetical protein